MHCTGSVAPHMERDAHCFGVHFPQVKAGSHVFRSQQVLQMPFRIPWGQYAASVEHPPALGPSTQAYRRFAPQTL